MCNRLADGARAAALPAAETAEPAAAPLRFSFVIPALNEEACVAACIRSIDAQHDGAVEIIVVDNGCTDRTAEIARQLGCRVVCEAKPGLSHARNRGAAVAQGEVVCFIDADGTLSGGWLSAARRCFARPEIGAVSGVSVYVHRNPLKLLWYNLYPLAVYAGVFLASRLLARMVFTGNNLAIRRELFQQIGGYEPIIGEGMWLSRRFWKQSQYRGVLCLRMILWNSPRGFEKLGFLSTCLYWAWASVTRRSQTGYTYKSR